MKGGRRICARWGAAILFLAGISRPCAGAEENALPAPTASAPSEAISGARQQLETIKASRDPHALPKAPLPSISVPELPSAPTTPTVLPKTKPAPADRKSPNWLLEAMSRPDESRGPAGNKVPREDRKSGRDEKTRERDFAERSGTTRKSEESEERERPIADNPLARYLGDWMTPQDFALLKPGLTHSLDARPGSESSNGAAGSWDAQSLVTRSPLLGGMIAPSTVPTTPRENPFLQSLTTNTPRAPGVVPVPLPAPSVSASAAANRPVMSPAPAPIQTPKVPEFAKPPQDEKYFKQLNRF